ncbi:MULTISPECIES: ABC transporter permease subunit [Shewanella]|uniref:ABC-2 type transporter n=2 Tax=Shewanella TaxID=22 RepID=B1KRD1_SHEWM|nr:MULTISPECIES: ABC transporter permease subunit [Shewanella]ACA86338.1 conserved hypothetical protein [Shewanella woodyi ATCC 51908]MBW8183893.1 ABC transporter permease subunit [Shewanella nanhaiensis]
MVKNSLILAKFELKKLLFNPRGLISLFAFSLVWLLILLYPIRSASSFLLTEEFRQLISAVFGENSINELFKWEVAEMAVFWIAALYLFPLFSIFVSADQFASDKSRGTFRFLSLRTGRDSIFFGRFTGHMLIQSLLLILTILATVILAASRDMSLLLPALSSGALVFINLFIILLPYTAMMAILSLYANTARQATIYAILFWAISAIIIAIINSQLPSLAELIQWVLPGAQLSMMINTQGFGSFVYAPIPLIQAAVLLFLGRSYMNRSSL